MRHDRTRTQITVAVAAIVNERGELLLEFRHMPELPEAHLKWGLPGGKVEFNEHPAQTVIREVKEETGLEVELVDGPVVVSKVWEFSDHDRHTIVLGYRAKLIGGALTVEGGHVADLQWFALDSIPYDKLLYKTIDFIRELVPEKV